MIEKLNWELERIPVAYGPWREGQDPARAEIETANFEVVAPAVRPVPGAASIRLPLVLRQGRARTRLRTWSECQGLRTTAGSSADAHFFPLAPVPQHLPESEQSRIWSVSGASSCIEY